MLCRAAHVVCMLVKYTDSTHVLFINKAQYDLGGCVNSQNNILVFRKSHINQPVLLHDVKVAVTAAMIIGPNFLSLRQYVHINTLHSENMSNYERILRKPYQQLTPQISVCIVYRVVLVASSKQWVVTLFFANSKPVQFLLVLSLSTYSFSVFVFEAVKRHAITLASKT